MVVVGVVGEEILVVGCDYFEPFPQLPQQLLVSGFDPVLHPPDTLHELFHLPPFFDQPDEPAHDSIPGQASPPNCRISITTKYFMYLGQRKEGLAVLALLSQRGCGLVFFFLVSMMAFFILHF
jgi:hypothetical protein